MTRKGTSTILLLFLVMIAFGNTDPPSTVIENLRNKWHYFQSGTYYPLNNEKLKVIYFTVDANKYKGDYLVIKDANPYFVFINNQLVKEIKEGECRLSLDSIQAIYSSDLAFSVYQKRGINKLATTVEAPVMVSHLFDKGLREGSYFLNFSVLACLILFAFFTALLRANPKLTLDYLNVIKIFSIQEREDDLLNSRVTSSVNLLFYLFGSLFASFTLLVLFHYGESLIAIASYFKIQSLSEGFLQWVRLSIWIAVVLICKLVLIYFVSFVFHLRDTPSIHFFNYMRLLLFTFVLIALASGLYFMFHGQSPSFYLRFLWIGIIIFMVGDLMIYFKLLVKTSFQRFHLFSYLCITEIIPLVILIRILLY